jgi:enoyl-CoA hydratase
VVIGLTIPHYGVELGTSAPDSSGLAQAAQVEAQRLAKLDMTAHAATKLRVRAPALRAMRAGIDEEFPERGY